jgi:hypothetical protein
VDRRLWLLYGFSVICGLGAVIGRVFVGRVAFAVVGISVVATIWVYVLESRAELKDSMSLFSNLAGLTIGAVVGFLCLSLMRSFMFFPYSQETGQKLGYKWLVYSVAIHVGGYLVVKNRRRYLSRADVEFPEAPDIPENIGLLPRSEQERIKSECEAYLTLMETQSKEFEEEMRGKWKRILFLFSGLVLVGAGYAILNFSK